jgi:hypothetical protein
MFRAAQEQSAVAHSDLVWGHRGEREPECGATKGDHTGNPRVRPRNPVEQMSIT